MGEWFKADLHIHSCLSPCGDLDASPRALAQAGAAAGLQVMALTDHNSSQNCPAFKAVCEKQGIVPIYGMEATSAEEIHCLCLFAGLGDALDFDHWMDERFPKLGSAQGQSGFDLEQFIVGEEESVIGAMDRPLWLASTLGYEEIAQEVRTRGGLFIPAHVDRSSFSMTSQLGFIPDGPFDALERYTPGSKPPYPTISDSDAHHPIQVAQRSSEYRLLPGQKPSFEAIATALRAQLENPKVDRVRPFHGDGRLRTW